MGWTLVTGSAKRLGKSIALELAARGHDVVVHYKSSEKEAEEVVQACRAFGVQSERIPGDFTTPASTAQFAAAYRARFPITKYLVNNVGNFFNAQASQTSDADWGEMFQSNLHAPFALMRELLPSLKQERGAIVNLGFAGAGTFVGNSGRVAYSLAKNGLWLLTRTLAFELAPYGVRVNMVSPGHLENTVLKVDPQTLPMKRLGLLDEVVRGVAFFLDDQNSYITGQNMEVAGGVRL